MYKQADITEDFAARSERVAQQLAELKQMVQVGLGLCREIAAKVRGVEALTYDPSLAYVRISRAVRLTVVLEARIAAEHEQALAGVVGPERRATKAQAVALEVLHTSIDNELKNNPDCDRERLTEMRESLPKMIAETFDKEDLCADAPITQVIAEISEALDIPVDWDLWRDTIAEAPPPDDLPKVPPDPRQPAEIDPDTEPV